MDRPDHLRRSIEHVVSQSPEPAQIIVVDASADDRSRDVARSFPQVHYLRNPKGGGYMTASRNLALREAHGDIIAFVDDDAFARSGWAAAILSTYVDNTVGAVGGRALNGQSGEESEGVQQIGKLLFGGQLTGNFAADPHRVVEVDHIIGCNMSFRRDVLARLGGFREDYVGISGVREDTDMSLRVRRLGYRILFNPAAVVDHIGAPQAKGRRFDWRYTYFAQRNHTAMLIRNFGVCSSIVWRNAVATTLGHFAGFVRRVAAAIARLLAAMAGTMAGLMVGIGLRLRTGGGPERRDADSEAIRVALYSSQCVRSEPASAA